MTTLNNQQEINLIEITVMILCLLPFVILIIGIVLYLSGKNINCRSHPIPFTNKKSWSCKHDTEKEDNEQFIKIGKIMMIVAGCVIALEGAVVITFMSFSSSK